VECEGRERLELMVMEYNALGKSGLKVSRLCLGAAFRASLFKADYDEDACIRTMHRALDAGINFIDTANYYSYGRSEEMLAKALRGKRDDVVLATKVCAQVKDDPGPNDTGLSRYHILRECERSLRRLGTDHIDLYLLHTPDETTPIEETLRALDDLVRQGKVRYIGCCNFAAWQVVQALWCSDVRNLNAFVSIQNQYSLLNRWELEPELLPVCREYGLGITTYSPLAVGLLTGRFRRGQPVPPGTPWSDGEPHAGQFEQAMTEQADAVVHCLIEIGAARGKTPAQVALRWLLDQPDVNAVILGPDLPSHVDEALGALGWQLDTDEWAILDALSAAPAPRKFA
jgi:aryl-alcohol dehydrogenase-like predicted oxidoreductase